MFAESVLLLHKKCYIPGGRPSMFAKSVLLLHKRCYIPGGRPSVFAEVDLIIRLEQLKDLEVLVI